MYTKEFIEKLITRTAFVNDSYYPLTIIMYGLLALLLTTVTINCFFRSNKTNNALLKITIGVVFSYGGIILYLAYFQENLQLAIGSLIGSIVVSTIIVVAFLKSKTQFKLSDNLLHKVLGIFFMIGGVYLYPLIEMAFGFKFPRIILLGFECPTFTFLCGLLIACLPTVNHRFAYILFGYSLISGVSAVIVGGYFDLIYASAALSGLIVLILHKSQNRITIK